MAEAGPSAKVTLCETPLEFHPQVTVAFTGTENEDGLKKLFPTVISPGGLLFGGVPTSDPLQVSALSVASPARSIFRVMFSPSWKLICIVRQPGRSSNRRTTWYARSVGSDNVFKFKRRSGFSPSACPRWVGAR